MSASWYRYHHLFAEVLRGRLTSGATASDGGDAAQPRQRLVRAAGADAEAVQHALAAQDWERAAA